MPRKKPDETPDENGILPSEDFSDGTEPIGPDITEEEAAERVTLTKAALAELLSEGEAVAYARGHADGLAEAKKLPLFEACKHAAERYWVSENDAQLPARFADIEAEYGE